MNNRVISGKSFEVDGHTVHFDPIRGGTYHLRLGGPTGELIGYVYKVGNASWRVNLGGGVVVEGKNRLVAAQKAIQKRGRTA